MSGTAKLDRRNIGALARRNLNKDHGIVDTLHLQAGRGGGNRQNPTSERRLKPETRCWCERHIVMSTWQRIYDGDGETCGRPDCKPKGTP